MLFAVRHLTKRYGRREVLSDVSFEVRPAEILGLIGPNGAGKSTLFECLAGTLAWDSGEFVTEQNRRDLLFYLPDEITPWPQETVSWALDFTVGFLGGRASLREEIIGQLNLGSILKQRLGTLSKGQRKRALLGVGLLTAQPALLIDEPFEGLDLRQARETAAVLETHAAKGRTLFLSIHQIHEAARLCERFLLLNEGHLRGQGTLEELGAMAGGNCSNLEEVFLALT